MRAYEQSVALVEASVPAATRKAREVRQQIESSISKLRQQLGRPVTAADVKEAVTKSLHDQLPSFIKAAVGDVAIDEKRGTARVTIHTSVPGGKR